MRFTITYLLEQKTSGYAKIQQLLQRYCVRLVSMLRKGRYDAFLPLKLPEPKKLLYSYLLRRGNFIPRLLLHLLMSVADIVIGMRLIGTPINLESQKW